MNLENGLSIYRDGRRIFLVVLVEYRTVSPRPAAASHRKTNLFSFSLFKSTCWLLMVPGFPSTIHDICWSCYKCTQNIIYIFIYIYRYRYNANNNNTHSNWNTHIHICTQAFQYSYVSVDLESSTKIPLVIPFSHMFNMSPIVDISKPIYKPLISFSLTTRDRLRLNTSERGSLRTSH